MIANFIYKREACERVLEQAIKDQEMRLIARDKTDKSLFDME
ncbi:hypothetical protein bcgnr5390_06100 [Bacillus luti]